MISVVFVDSDRVASKLIRWLTWSTVSHVGLLDRATGTVIDSRLGLGGVTEYPFEHLLRDYPRITVVDFPNVPDTALNYARSQVGKPYDWTALVSFLSHRNWQKDDKWFCSELVAWACLMSGHPLINKESWRVAPQDLLEVLP